ncbi:MAG: hypothetical protein ACR2F1_15630 [Nitrososphaeraceae archaeon]
MSGDDRFNRYKDVRYRNIDRESFVRFLASLNFFESSLSETVTYFSNGFITIDVPNKNHILSIYIVRIQEYMENNGGITEERFLERLQHFRKNNNS